MMRAVRTHTSEKWLLLYIERWLKAPIRLQDETLRYPEKGTPQGGVISPLLANLFLHYAFDRWMDRRYPYVPFERYADDVVCHCKSRVQAESLKQRLNERMHEVGLELHPDKTLIVYCQDSNRKGTYDKVSFDFLGYTFRPRLSKNRFGKYFINFSPAISKKAKAKVLRTIRDWRIHRRTLLEIKDLAVKINPVLRGWINYYGRYYKSAIEPLLKHLNRRLAKWVMRKYKRFRYHELKAYHWLGGVAHRDPNLFVHWAHGIKPSTGR